MNISKVKFPLEEVVGEKGLLVGVAYVYEYKEGKRTEKVIGTKYDILLIERKYDTLSIKVMDKPIITSKELDNRDIPPTVYFDGVYGKIYSLNNQIKMSVTAEEITLIGGDNLDDEI